MEGKATVFDIPISCNSFFKEIRKVAVLIRHPLSSITWCILILFFGLLQAWFVLVIHYAILQNAPLFPKKLFMDGALLFFSNTLISSLALDNHYLSKKNLLHNSFVEHIMFAAFPFIIIICSIILFSTCYILDTFEPHVKINQPLISSVELGIIISSLIYAFFIKLNNFKLD